MKWRKYTVETTTAAEDFISAALMDLGIEGIEIEDNVPLSAADQADMFIDFLPELAADDGTSRVSFYIEDDGSDQSTLLMRVKAALEELRQTVDVGSARITSSETEDLDWINNWKQYFRSFTIRLDEEAEGSGEDADQLQHTCEKSSAGVRRQSMNREILIKPTWEELPAEEREGRIVIEIDPGVSFGTGKHETTQLCIRELMKYIADSPRVLDVGCGSGILSIAALKLGAREVNGTDLDADCITSTLENLRVNHLQDVKTLFLRGNVIDDATLRGQLGGDYDIVVANILADVIIPMVPVVATMLRKGGYFITSGIIDFKEQLVCEAMTAAGFTILEVRHQGEWVGITATL